ncbi:MAG: hypothetical protein ABIS35_02435 [Terracoccus sp.]
MSRVRAAVAALLIVVGVALVPLSVTAIWLRATVTDTDTYVATVAPLATNPAVVEAVEVQLTAQVMDAVQRQQLLPRATAALEEQGIPRVLAQTLNLLADPLGARIEDLVRRVVDRVVQSRSFATAWTESNRLAHAQLIAILSRDQDNIVVSDGRTVSLRVATLVDTLGTALVEAGVPLSGRIPEVTATIPLATTDSLATVHTAYVALRASVWVLPAVALMLIAGGIGLSRGRRRAGLLTGAGVVAGCVLLLLGLALARTSMTGDLQPTTQAAAAAVLDAVTGDLKRLVRLVVAVTLVVLLVLLLAGPSPAAQRSRLLTANAWERTRTALGRVGPARPVLVALAVVCTLVIVFAGGTGVAWTVVLVVIGLLSAGAAALARPTPPSATEDGARP